MAAFDSVAIASGTGDVQAVAAGKFLRLIGFSVGEDAGTAAAAEIKIFNGTSTGGEVVVPACNLAADGFGTFWYGPDGIPCANGIYLNRVTGTTEVVIYYSNV